VADVVERIFHAPLRAYTTLRAGGPAEELAFAANVEQLAKLALAAQESGKGVTLLGRGSNVLPSDAGVHGLTVINRATGIRVAKSGEVVADTGCDFQELFLKTAQAGLRGLEYAVGIPGTLGGALVSNAGAYRSNVSEFITGLEIVFNGERAWVSPAWMQFSYRNSILRRPDPPSAVVLRVSMTLPAGERKRIYDEARDYQRQRISKQPPSASAGSFFKNVNDRTLAESLDLLPPAMRAAGVVPAGYLIEAAGLKGYRVGGAMLGRRHANFMLNIGGASATEIRNVAEHAKNVVRDRFGVVLEEEVLYLGDWSRYRPPAT
jgi:UDP-N-acetylmuramate dehydrogenase